jgi:Raf kinase inhibitor-like YbhB/YbcL family protein
MKGFSLTSPAFSQGEEIPARFTADGADVSPELRIGDPPGGTVTFALIMDDPDAPMGTWVHWVVWNIPGAARSVPEGTLPEGSTEGRNSWGRTGYGGPSPPKGTGVHRYFFKLYALDTRLELPPTADKAALLDAMKGHVLGEAELMGTYTRDR